MESRLKRLSMHLEANDESEWIKSGCYSSSLFRYKEEKLDIVHSNLRDDQTEYMKTFLLRRLTKNAIYIGTGNFSVMEFSLNTNTLTPATCFYVSFHCSDEESPDSNSTTPRSQAIFCLVAPPEAQLEIYRAELQTFCRRQVDFIKETSFKDRLKLWPFHSLGFFGRVVSNLGLKISYLLEAVLRQYKINVSQDLDSQLQADIQSFIAAASLAELLSIVTAPEDRTTVTFGPELLSNLNPETDKLEAVNMNGSVDLDVSSFCLNWGKLFDHVSSSPTTIKKTVESFKLKIIQDMNDLRRALKQAETDYYSLYFVYLFLKNTGYKSTLLEYAKHESDSPKDVISILQRFNGYENNMKNLKERP
ncbi:protein Njmu-R1-like [Neocloeon triangulifer]|uniref:protein Njmu-R1-like n=1 Tax=Neocloeon triangulifer TaxID=2078957 RepID=UPI00286F61CE|nr:protein Njmu-R1-like [Neocloeon triangulifer]